MADNIAITAGSGTSMATDDIGGVHYQRVKPSWGADGSAADVSNAAPLPVVPGASSSVVGASVHSAGSVTTTPQTAKGSAGNLYGVFVENPNVDSVWVQVFDTAGTPTLGSDTPTITWSVPPGDGASVYGVLERMLGVPVAFASGVKYAITTTRAGSTAPSAGCSVTVIYK